MKIGLCKLCNVKSYLVNESHIISKFFKEGLNNEEVFYLLNTSPRKYPKQKGFNRKPVQNLPFDKYIFCESCEGKISNYEDLFKRRIYKANESIFGDDRYKVYKSIFNYSYLQYNNNNMNYIIGFLFSLIFRLSISSHSAFKDFKLSDSLEGEIRNFLLGYSYTIQDWNFVILSPYPNSKISTDLILFDYQTDVLFLNKIMVKFYPPDVCMPDKYNFVDANQSNLPRIILVSDNKWRFARNYEIHKLVNAAKNNMSFEEWNNYIKRI